MRKAGVRGILFSIVSLIAIPAFSQTMQTVGDLALIEELPPEVRSIVYEKVAEFLKRYPHTLRENMIIAVDAKGGIYVLDKNVSEIAGVGKPSSVL
ncbi:hypothetical protein BH10BDE1_BH10BDE1_28150 [soil metagenome]